MARPDPHNRPWAATRRGLAAELGSIDGVLPGSVVVRYMRCGKPGCACKTNPPALHGPYIQWTRTVDGKTVTRFLSEQELARYQPWFDNARRLKELVAKLEVASVHALESEHRRAHHDNRQQITAPLPALLWSITPPQTRIPHARLPQHIRSPPDDATHYLLSTHVRPAQSTSLRCVSVARILCGVAVGVVRQRLVSWWWDLPLRWKGFIAVALPSLVLLASIVAVVVGFRRGDQRLGVVVAGAVLATLLSWIGVLLFTRSIVGRVETVGAVAARVIDGDTSVDVEEPARDELGLLIRELQRAAELLILHNAELERSRDAERALVEREQTIREVIRRVHEAVGQEEVLATTVRELGKATGSDGVFIFLVEDGKVGTVLAEWTTDGVAGIGVGRSLPPDEQRDANFGLLVRQPNAIAVDDVAASGLLPQTRALLGNLDIGSLLLAPVLGEEDPLAAMVLITAGRSRPWPPGSERLAEAVAANVATALAHARLYEREREMVQRLRELDQAKSDFVASVSHELRTPLTSIRGYVEMLGDGDAGDLEPDQHRMLEVVQRNADRLLALIEDLLTLSRIESGAFRVARVPVALDGVVYATLEELRPQAAARGVELVADVASDVPTVLGDSSQLERVLFNLLSNAIKFTVDGGCVVVRVRPFGTVVEVDVEDEGIGIPEAEQDRLFSRFFRSSTSQERAIQGTGLGLVIVKSIVEHHGGDIAVRSQPDVGTTFTIRLPAAATPVGVL